MAFLDFKITAETSAKIIIIAAATIFGAAYSLSATLIALDLARQSASQTFIGMNAAMHAVGVLVMAVFLPRIVSQLGIRTSMLLAFTVVSVLLVLFPVSPSIWLWFPMRLALGAASETLFVLSETWTNSLTNDSGRARTMALYTASLSTGFAAGPIIYSVSESSTFSYLFGAAIVLIPIALLSLSNIKAPHFEKPTHGSTLRYVKAAPIALFAVGLNAAIEAAGLSFLALYAVRLGWPEPEATRLMTCMLVGAILLQLPIGWLADNMNRLYLVRALALLAALGALIWPVALSSLMLTYVILFVWGGLFVGIYTVVMAIVGDRFSGTDLVGIYAAMGVIWGVGALVGPLSAGITMEATRNGLAYFTALACGAFFLITMLPTNQVGASPRKHRT